MTRLVFAFVLSTVCAISIRAEELPGTRPLMREGDIAAQMVAGIDKYLMRELDGAAKGGADKWHVNTTDLKSYLESVKPNRERLAKILGVVDERVKPVIMEYVGDGKPSALVAETKAYKVYAVRWPALAGVDGEGLLLEPVEKAKACVVAIPDADQTPEQIVGLAAGVPPESQFAHRLAAAGCRVVVPVLIDRQPTTWEGSVGKRATNIPHREFIWRMAYEMGRHPIGYEVQKVLAAVDWFRASPGGTTGNEFPVGVYGYGEGGLIALYAGALDPRIAVTVASGIEYGGRSDVWQEPIDRSVWASLPEFRDEHLRKLFGGRSLIYEHAHQPKFDLPNPPGYRQQAAGGRLATSEAVRLEMADADAHKRMNLKGEAVEDKPVTFHWRTMTLPNGQFGHPKVVTQMLVDMHFDTEPKAFEAGKDLRAGFSHAARQKRQFEQLVAFTQKLWRTSEPVRKRFWAQADASSPAKWEQTSEPLRDDFWDNIIGRLPKQTEPMTPRTRVIYDTPKWKGYEVTLDLYPDVFAYGILCVPKNLKPGEKRPVVVCQHGLEGRAQDVCDPNKKSVYHSYAAQLADMGYITYAPQNPYIGQEKFRILLRKSHPLKLSLYAFIVRQHETATDWLASLPFVQADKIAFYGLSYGGKTAMRIPALVKRYCLSICAGDFNEWVGKNVSVDFPGSYMWTIEYDMYEFNLGHTFNYAEMANLIAPRPFMVERGHDDGVGIDEMIAYEYAKVRYLYANRLKIPDNTTIEFRPGGHEIFLKGTAEFLKKHTGWPK